VTIIDCQQAGRGFYFHNGEDSTASIRGFTVKNGRQTDGIYSGGGLLCVNSSPSIIGCIFSNNVATSHISTVYGGAVYAFGSTTRISKCIFKGNAVWDYDGWGEAYGGAIAARQSMLTIDNCLFIGNRAGHGGALFASASSVLAVENCTFYANRTGFEYAGSALFLGYWSSSDMSTATLEKCIISFGRSGGAIQCRDSTNFASLACCDVYGNAGGDWVGCIVDQAESDGNFSLDPEFCDTANIDLTLNPLSPCLPANNECEALIGALGAGCDCCRTRGDINHDGYNGVDISDLVYLVDFMFNGSTGPPCLIEANVDGSADTVVDISDLVYMVEFMFTGGDPPLPCP
jgi:predicted outer membrane repeat protein